VCRRVPEFESLDPSFLPADFSAEKGAWFRAVGSHDPSDPIGTLGWVNKSCMDAEGIVRACRRANKRLRHQGGARRQDCGLRAVSQAYDGGAFAGELQCILVTRRASPKLSCSSMNGDRQRGSKRSGIWQAAYPSECRVRMAVRGKAVG